MRLLSKLKVPGTGSTIELLTGDVSAIPSNHSVDLLAISAFPGQYATTPGTVIRALDDVGLSVQALAETPYEDLRETHSCWLSRPIGRKYANLHFSRILCFEPSESGRAPELVGDVFRALGSFSLGSPRIKTVAMPLLATGFQGESSLGMLRAILTAAFNWLGRGLPIKKVKIVVRPGRPDLEMLRQQFRTTERKFVGTLAKKQNGAAFAHEYRAARAGRAGTVQLRPAYDVFVSYSRKDKTVAQHLLKCLERHGLRVFIDEHSIDVGAVWQQAISDALDRCHSTALICSPDFVASKHCQEEFQIARLRRLENGIPTFPLLVRDTVLPPSMRVLNYVDCRKSDKDKIASAAAKIAAQLRRTADTLQGRHRP